MIVPALAFATVCERGAVARGVIPGIITERARGSIAPGGVAHFTCAGG